MSAGTSGMRFTIIVLCLWRKNPSPEAENAADVCVVGDRDGEDDGGPRMEDGDGAWR